MRRRIHPSSPSTRPPPITPQHPPSPTLFTTNKQTNQPNHLWSCLVSSTPPPNQKNPTSWFSILFPSATFCEVLRARRPEGKRMGGQERQQPPPRRSWPGRGGAQVRHLRFRSVSSSTPPSSTLSPTPNVLLGGGSWTWPRLWWPRALSHYSLTTHNSDQLKNKSVHTENKQTLYTVCFRHCKAWQKPTSSGFFVLIFILLGVLYAYIYEYEYIVRMCMNVVVFSFIEKKVRSEKSMPGTILIFLPPYVFALIGSSPLLGSPSLTLSC